jgi:hypothetical protein
MSRSGHEVKNEASNVHIPVIDAYALQSSVNRSDVTDHISCRHNGGRSLEAELQTTRTHIEEPFVDSDRSQGP